MRRCHCHSTNICRRISFCSVFRVYCAIRCMGARKRRGLIPSGTGALGVPWYFTIADHPGPPSLRSAALPVDHQGKSRQQTRIKTRTSCALVLTYGRSEVSRKTSSDEDPQVLESSATTLVWKLRGLIRNRPNAGQGSFTLMNDSPREPGDSSWNPRSDP